ncbi:MAG: c-type cytochrome [Planctomycetales bacterium]|nr:c-type cytochrome [Planctomycetales bacterium]
MVGFCFRAAAVEPPSDGWLEVEVPGVWEASTASPELRNHDGFAWYRCWFELPGSWREHDVELYVEHVDNCHEVYVNGFRVGGRGAFPPQFEDGVGPARSYLLGREFLRMGAVHTLAIRVYDDGGQGGFRREAPALVSGDQAIHLGGRWQIHAGDDLSWRMRVDGMPAFTFREVGARDSLGHEWESSPLRPRLAREALRVPDDLGVDLLLSEPEITQPVFLNFDERGRMWLVEYRQYPHPAELRIVSRDQYWRNVYDKVPPPPPHNDLGMDRISIHEDSDGDGVFDKHSTFVEGLNMVTSVARGRGGVWVLNPPYLMFYPDRDNDDRPDGDPVVHLRGFWLEDSHSIANSLRWGPDGWLYGAQGSTVSGDIEVMVGDVRSPPVHTMGQLIWRYHPEQHRFEIWAEGGGNAFGCEIDSRGRIFSGHNGGDTRGFHYPQHGYLRKGFNKHGPLSNPYAFGYFPEMPHHSVARFTHTFEIYDGEALPQDYRGKLFGCDPINRTVPVAEITPDGATFRTRDVGNALATDDEWFRPVAVRSGPDGYLYVCDWCDNQVGHYISHQGLMDKSHGRVYRIRSTDPSYLQPFDLTRYSSQELVALLRHPNRWHRETARRLIADRRDDKLLPELKRRVRGEQGQFALECFWAVNLSGGFDEPWAAETLGHRDPYVRAWAVRLLGDMPRISDRIAATLAELAGEESHVEVRSQLASTAKRLPAGQSLPIVRELIGRDVDREDRYVPLLVWWALESKCGDEADEVLTMWADSGLWKGRLALEEILPRQMRRWAATGRREDLHRCAQLFEMAGSEEATGRLMAGFEAAYEGRRIDDVPARLIAALKEAGGGSLALQVRLGDPTSIDAALSRVSDERMGQVERLELIRVLGQVRPREAEGVFLDIISQTKESLVRQESLGALAGFESPAIADRILSLYDQWSPDEQAAAQAMLVARANWVRAMLDALESGRLDRLSLSIGTMQRCGMHKDPLIKERAAKLFGDMSPANDAALQREVARIKDVVLSGDGNPYEGQKLFRQSCVKCHYLFNEGERIGPDLTAYQRHDLQAMSLAIGHPSAEIREGFENYTMVVDDGRIVSGVIGDRDDRVVVVRTADGHSTSLPRDAVEEMVVNRQSLMPDDILKGWSEEQIRDLFAYLRSTQPLNN